MANVLSGSQTAMPLRSFFPIRVAILQFCVCRYALCVGTWSLCIGWTQSLLMPITGHVWALTWLWSTVLWVPQSYSWTLKITSSHHISSHVTKEHALLLRAMLSNTSCRHGYSQHIAHSGPANRYCHVYRLGSDLSLKCPSSIWGDDIFCACCNSLLHSPEFRSGVVCTPGYAL